MTDTPDMFECRLVGYSKQSRKDGDWVEVRFHIHPGDVTPALAQAPLKTIFMVAATPAERTEKPKRTWNEIPLSEQAGILCADHGFQTWLEHESSVNGWPEVKGTDPTNWATETVRAYCGVKSRSEIIPETHHGKLWLLLSEKYRQSHGLIAERTT